MTEGHPACEKPAAAIFRSSEVFPWTPIQTQNESAISTVAAVVVLIVVMPVLQLLLLVVSKYVSK